MPHRTNPVAHRTLFIAHFLLVPGRLPLEAPRARAPL